MVYGNIGNIKKIRSIQKIGKWENREYEISMENMKNSKYAWTLIKKL